MSDEGDKIAGSLKNKRLPVVQASLVIKQASLWVICQHHPPLMEALWCRINVSHMMLQRAGLWESADPRGSTEHLAV